MNLETTTLYQSIQPRYPELRGKVAVVTGSARGIGRGTAIRLVKEGMRVVINSNEPGRVATLTAELRALGADVLPVPADLSHSDEINKLFDETLTAFGTVDLLVNNAALLRAGGLFGMAEDFLDLALATNIKAPYLCALRAAEVMRQSGGGSMVHISSVGGIQAHWNGHPYDATKSAIDGMTRAMALTLAEYNIRVNAIGPGAIYTEQLPPLADTGMQAVAKRIPVGRFGSMLEIAAMIAFLASNEASYITGQVIYVDGGITAQLSPPGQPI